MAVTRLAPEEATRILNGFQRDARAMFEQLLPSLRHRGLYPDASVDGCFSHVVFQHIPDPAITLNYVREMGRVLRPGGWAVFQVSTNPELHHEPAPYRVRTGLRIRIKGLLGTHQPADQERSHEERSHEERSWWGSAVEVESLRSATEQGGLQIERLVGEGTQFTTVLARRAS